MNTQEFLKHCGDNSCGNCCFTDACCAWKTSIGHTFSSKNYNKRKAEFLTKYLRKKKLEKLLS